MIKLKSPAKLNLYLRILNKRPDGYHNIVTLFERIDLCDDIILRNRHPAKAGSREREKGIKIVCDDSGVPKGSQNLAYKAAKALMDYTARKAGIEIKIKKRIPVGAGLAGGSSNAAAVLLGLNRLWKLKLSQKELLNLGAKIGADVNFFLLGKRFAIGTGRGDDLGPLDVPKPIWHVLVSPGHKLSTKDIYKYWDDINNNTHRAKITLTDALADVKILHHSIQKIDLDSLAKNLHNDLEQSAQVKDNTILKIKQFLKITHRVRGVLMSGSGPSVFGIMPSRKEAMRIKQGLAALKNKWQIFVAKTY